jgi:hypothetical protein
VQFAAVAVHVQIAQHRQLRRSRLLHHFAEMREVAVRAAALQHQPAVSIE